MAICSVIDPAMKLIPKAFSGWVAIFEKNIQTVPNLKIGMASVAVILTSVFGVSAAMALAPGANDFSDLGLDLSHLSFKADDALNEMAFCPECGIVESIRKTAQVDNQVLTGTVGHIRSQQNAMAEKTVEVTLRMKDGSSHQFIDANPENWRSGERVILISGMNR